VLEGPRGRLGPRLADGRDRRHGAGRGRADPPPPELEAAKTAKDKSHLLAEKVAEYRKLHANPYRAAAALYVDDVIRPSWTRRLLIERLVTLRAKRDQRPQKKHGNIPM
jgi:Acetyl-CoA carboxylase, carboxyltransferase component (subunits alpha and beta)